MAGNVSGIIEKFQSGVNFLTIDKQSTFWHPLGQDQSEKLEGIVNEYVLLINSSTVSKFPDYKVNLIFSYCETSASKIAIY